MILRSEGLRLHGRTVLRLQLSDDLIVDFVSMCLGVVIQHPLFSLQLDGFGVLLQTFEVRFVPVALVSSSARKEDTDFIFATTK